jgi:two-component system chemotaxis response regulator CheB
VINVAIADDSPFTCKLLASYVEDGGECKVVGLAHDAQSTIELIRRETPDVLTLDLQIPGGDGLDLLRRLADEPPASIVVISGVTRLAAATTLKALELAPSTSS